MILLIDNYDSFSYNLFQMVGAIDPDIKVIRNDAVEAKEALQLNPSGIILSPGPGHPSRAGICEQIALDAGDVPVLGVCLGHQAICEALGGKVGYAKKLMHGKSSMIKADTTSALFKGMPPEFKVARYHSLAADESKIPQCLKVTAATDDGEIMAVEHRERPLYGVQFHPESILTPQGSQILQNFVDIAYGGWP